VLGVSGHSKLYPTSLGGLKRGLGAPGDHRRLRFRPHRQDADRQSIGSRHVTADETHPGRFQPEQEVSVAGQPVELRNQQRGMVDLAGDHGALQLRPVRLAPAFHFREFGDDIA